MTKNQNPKKGFTLIELLVVIAIVALLATVAMVAMNNARQDSRNTKRKADIKQIASALEVYLNNYKVYPFNRAYGEIELDLLNYKWDSSCGTDDVAGTDFLEYLQNVGIMAILPEDPNSTTPNTCYLYTSTDNSNNYIDGYYLMAYLEGQNGEQACDLVGLPARYTCISNSH